MGEVTLKRLESLNPNAVVSPDYGRNDPLMRDAVSTSLNFDVDGFAPPKPDLSHTPTARRGAIRRFCTKPTRPCFVKIRRLRRYARTFFCKNFTPLAPDHPVNGDFLERVNWWLPLTNYPLSRKTELMNLALEMASEYDLSNFDVKSFIKEETYPEYKDSRCINARSDECKLLLGPYFKAIEEVTYKNPYFIKHVPVCDRAQYIYDMLWTPDGKYVASDYTSFEAHFTPEMMHAIEFEFYSYMSAPLGNSLFMWICYNILAGRNNVAFKSFTVRVDGIRMSGEMCTSLGNGIANLTIMFFVLETSGCTEIRGVVEGDDALFAFSGSLPTRAMFNTLGFDIKLEYHENLSHASFCGLVFDLEDRKNVTDPRQVLLNMSWIGRKYNRANARTRSILARAKAFSMLYAYPGCPIIAACAKWILRCTRSIDITLYVTRNRNLNAWERDWLLEAQQYGSAIIHTDTVIGDNTRDLVKKLYGIDEKQQIDLEDYFDSLNELTPMRHPVLDEIMPAVSSHVFDHYVRDCLPDDITYRTDLSDKPLAPTYDAREKLIVANQTLVGDFAYASKGVRARDRVTLFSNFNPA